MLVEGANIGHGGASRSMFLSRKLPEVGRYWVFKSYTGNVAKLLSRLEYVGYTFIQTGHSVSNLVDQECLLLPW